MKAFVDFIIANWDIILLLVVLLTADILLVFKGEKSVVMKMLYVMVTEAEKAYGSGTGSLKLAAVIDKIYPKLPPFLRIFVGAKTLQCWIETVLEEAKRSWEANENLANYIEK